MSPEAAGTVIAALIASFTGLGAYVANVRTRRFESALKKTDDAAALQAAEVDGWKALIESLSLQYQASVGEAMELRGRLQSGNDRFDALTIELRQAHERIAVLEERIEEMRAEIKRLDGSVEEINNVGKQGPPGEPGMAGERGKQGAPGVAG